MAIKYACDSDVEASRDHCSPLEAARIIHVAFVEKSTAIAKTSDTGYASAITTAELGCNAFLLRDVNGTYDGGEPKDGKPRGSQPSRITGGSHKVSFTDFEGFGNAAFWNSMRDNAGKYNFYFMTENFAFAVEGKYLIIKPKLPIGDDNTEEIQAEVEVSWNGKDIPVPVEISTATFGTSPEIPFSAVVDNGGETISGNTITVGNGTSMAPSFDFSLTSGGANVAETLEVAPGYTLPSWVTLNSTARTLTGTGPATAATTVLKLIGKNACGVPGTIEITLVATGGA